MENQKFEQWWDAQGQYVRAGGGQYEISFAFAAWQHQAARIAELEAQVKALQESLPVLETDAHFIFNNPPGECPQAVLDVIEWHAGSVRVALEAAHNIK